MRPVQVVLTDRDQVIIHADVVDGGAGDRAVGRRDGKGAGGKVFPFRAVVSLGGVHHAAVHGAVPLDPGRHDPHRPILPPAPGETVQKGPACRDMPGETVREQGKGPVKF